MKYFIEKLFGDMRQTVIYNTVLPSFRKTFIFNNYLQVLYQRYLKLLSRSLFMILSCEHLKKSSLLMSIATTLFCVYNPNVSVAKDIFSNKVIEKAKNSVVTIEVTSSLSSDLGKGRKWSGTGSVLSKKHGIILTNAHVSGRAIIGKHDIIFQNGDRVDAKLLYYDPWLDFAFLKVDSKQIPKKVEEITFSSSNPKINQKALIIGNNAGKSFSIHTGYVCDIYGITGSMPQHYIKFALNTKGGSSGSPVFNRKGEVIALNFAGDQTFALAAHPEYFRYAIKYILNNNVPKRQHIGIIAGLYSLSKAVQYRGFSKEKLTKYVKNFPKSNANTIIVHTVLKNTPAYGKLYNGDIIWAVNGKIIGPNLIDLDMAMNKSSNKEIELTVIRDGKELVLNLGLYDLEATKITEIIDFNKRVIFKMDDIWSLRTGAPAGTVTGTGDMLSKIFFKLLSINLIPINTLEDIVKAIPKLVKNKYYFVDIFSYSPYFINNFMGSFRVGGIKIRLDGFYKSLNAPKIYRLNSTTKEWESKIIS